MAKMVKEETDNVQRRTDALLIQEKTFPKVINADNMVLNTMSLDHSWIDRMGSKLRTAYLETIGNACKENNVHFNETLKTRVPKFRQGDNSLKAHQIFDQKAKKGKEKVNVHKGSVVQHFGLDCGFFNDAIRPLNHNMMLSFGQFKGLFKPNELETFAEKAKEKNVWALGSVQLKLNFFNQAVASSLFPQNSRLTQFVEQKMASKPKDFGHVSFEARIAPSSTASSARGTAPLQEIHKAYFKYLGYRNMHYVLCFDGKGEKIPTSLQVIDPALNVLLKEPLSEHNRLENVLAGKAFKWGQRVINHGQEFIKAEALEAHTFASSLGVVE